MVFEARERSKKPLLFMEKAIGEIKFRLTLSSSLWENSNVKSSRIKWDEIIDDG
jgi:hypothetical protein